MTALRVAFALTTMVALTAGCAEQVGVSNQADSFSYGGQVASKDGVQSYNWENTQGKAQVNWGGQASSGSMDLVIKDSAGKQVYSKSITGATQSGSNEVTATGAKGVWTIQLTFGDFTGQMGLNVVAEYGGAGSYCPPNVPGCA